MSNFRNSSAHSFIPDFDQKYEARHFGEEIYDDTQDNENSKMMQKIANPESDSDTESLTLDLNKLSGLSSSSSLSWSDECYDNETSKKVHTELKRMDRILRGEEDIPPHYDREEFELWMNLFPNLTIFDMEKTPVNSVHNIIEQLNNELSVYGYESSKKDCDGLALNASKENSSTVIDIADMRPRRTLNQHSPNPNSRRRSNVEHKLFVVSNKPNSFDTEKYLRISPLMHKPAERKPSSKSLFSQQTCREDLGKEYNSLPFIKVNESANTRLLSKTGNQEKSVIDEKKERNSSRLVLPPIITDQFRSVSAIPRQSYTTLSALSINSNIIGKRKRKYSNNFLENPVSSRIERNRYFL